MSPQDAPPTQQPAVETNWYELTAQQAVEQLKVDPASGLDGAEWQQRRERHGANILTPPRRKGPLLRFLLQFHNVLIYVLLGAAVVTMLMRHWLDAGVIFGVVVVNALIGFIQEGKAERALEAIRNMLSQQAMVLREGKRALIPAEELVPGDIVFLQSGDKVPADLRLLKVKELRIDEASLTGESIPSEKASEPVATEAAIGDRSSMAYSGTLVTYGQGTGVVTATGDETELGRINKMLAEVPPLVTRLLVQMADFGRKLTVAIFTLAAITFAFGYLLKGFRADEMFLATVGLAVAAIPEGLPAIITITLALGVQAMAGRNAIVRRLPAVETLGSVTIICSDKTGTLTKNEMTVQEVVTARQGFTISGIGYAPRGVFSLEGNGEGEDINPHDFPALAEICRAAMLCNDSAIVPAADDQWQANGDPTEAALLTMAMKAGLEGETLRAQYPRTDLIPFESEHKFMATLHHDHQGQAMIYLKGAPEVVLNMCADQWREGERRELDRAFWEERMEKIAGRGQRLLALAVKNPDGGQRELNFADVKEGMTMLGLVGIIDPPREEAITAVSQCRTAGIRVKMITGDHAVTARAIASRMGFAATDQAVTGQEIEEMDDATLQRQALAVDVFARVSPEHKLRLVRLLQESGEVVAMTGDGVNDAPALKQADVGVAMGIKGTEVAKEAAEIVLTDDNFASIAHAVGEGRTVYNNIRKSITFILPTNGGQAGVIIAAVMAGQILPITPVQILWVNMITAVTLALALAFEPAEPDVMEQPPRDPREGVLNGFLIWRVFFVSLIMVAGVFNFFVWKVEQGVEIEVARTTAVNTLILFQIYYLFNSRSLHRQIDSLKLFHQNRYVLIAIGAVIFLQALFTYAPFMHRLFGTAPVAAGDWPLMILAAASVFFLVEGEKWLLLRWRARRERPRPES
ncbi:cation-transporting P-type ATPase [Desulfurivibrio sp. D14AmB]|uniref:cation-transporting P-type ATPase n=1 Tax=Desulfurivibrio sp. D14AmB TaxID=3374370 RepID=UPI00376EAD32